MLMKIKKNIRHRIYNILLPIVFFFIWQFCLDLYGLYLKNEKSLSNVSIRFKFDSRMKERPYRVFLVRDQDLYKVQEWKEPKFFQFYQSWQDVYNFYNIKPRKIMKNLEHLKLFFYIYRIDDYPVEKSKQ